MCSRVFVFVRFSAAEYVKSVPTFTRCTSFSPACSQRQIGEDIRLVFCQANEVRWDDAEGRRARSHRVQGKYKNDLLMLSAASPYRSAVFLVAAGCLPARPAHAPRDTTTAELRNGWKIDPRY